MILMMAGWSCVRGEHTSCLTIRIYSMNLGDSGLFGIFFTAKTMPDCLFTARYTLPKDPLPIGGSSTEYSSEISYFLG
jgi:hypothetical protein